MSEQPDTRRTTFDQAAELYHQARPGYPEALFDDIVGLSGIPAGGRILEIGCGTGQATLPLARRGYQIVAIELGANLAAVAQRNLAPYPNARVIISTFEEWPLEPEAFDLVISATAFHWVDPAIKYTKAARVLKPGGAIALAWNLHVHTSSDNGFFTAVQQVYERVTPGQAKHYPGLPRAEDIGEPVRDEIAATGLFEQVTVRRYRWEQPYTAQSYTDLLNTYSDHRSLEPERREQLLSGIANLIDTSYGGRILKGYLTILYLARRR